MWKRVIIRPELLQKAKEKYYERKGRWVLSWKQGSLKKKDKQNLNIKTCQKKKKKQKKNMERIDTETWKKKQGKI